MTQTIPTVQSYMTASPYTIDADQTLDVAHARIYQGRIRHLPVTRLDQLVGVLTERDLALSAVGAVDLSSIKVEEVMSVAIYKVSASAPLHQVAHEMASKRLDFAVVVENGAVTGILTTVDICSAFAASAVETARLEDLARLHASQDRTARDRR